MYKALVFEAVVCMLLLPAPLALGSKRLGLKHEKGRLTVDEVGEPGRAGSVDEGVHG
jgi:hypothetical protein